MRSFARYWLPPLLWMALIWGVSSDLGSVDNTAGPVGWIVTMLFPWATAAQIELAHRVIRKFGHLTEYAILAALAISIAWAIADEVHQSFVPSRSASALDVLFDSAGAALILFVVARLHLEPRIQRVAQAVAEEVDA